MRLKIFDINHFLRRNNFTFEVLAEKIGCGSSLIGARVTGRATPSFDKCLKLLELNMTIEEMFGTELAEKIPHFTEEKELVKEGDFEKKVCEILVKYLSKGVE